MGESVYLKEKRERKKCKKTKTNKKPKPKQKPNKLKYFLCFSFFQVGDQYAKVHLLRNTKPNWQRLWAEVVYIPVGVW